MHITHHASCFYEVCTVKYPTYHHNMNLLCLYEFETFHLLTFIASYTMLLIGGMSLHAEKCNTVSSFKRLVISLHISVTLSHLQRYSANQVRRTRIVYIETLLHCFMMDCWKFQLLACYYFIIEFKQLFKNVYCSSLTRKFYCSGR